MANPSPSVAECETQLQYVVHILDELDLYCNANTDNFAGQQDTLQQNVEGVYTPVGLADAIADSRGKLSSILSPAGVRQYLDPVIREYGRAAGIVESDPVEIVRRLWTYYDDNSKTVNARDFTFGSPSAGGSNVGDGTLYRLTIDEGGYDLEAVHAPDTYEFKCIEDYGRDLEFQEKFEVRALEAEPDYLSVAGSGIVDEIQALSKSQVQTYLKNPSLDQYSGTAAGGDLSFDGWTLSDSGDGSVFEENTTSTYIYHGEPSVSTPVSIRFTTNGNFYQKPIDEGKKIPTDLPMFFGFALYRRSSCDGTLTAAFGAESRAVDVSTLSNNDFTYIVCEATPGQNQWYKQTKEADFDIKFTLASNTTGSCYISCICWHPFQFIGGSYFALIPGATSFLVDDIFTFSDTENATRAKIQYWIWRGYGLYLPSNAAGAETVADPS